MTKKSSGQLTDDSCSYSVELNGWGLGTDIRRGVLPEINQIGRARNIEEAKRASNDTKNTRPTKKAEKPRSELKRGWDDQDVIGIAIKTGVILQIYHKQELRNSPTYSSIIYTQRKGHPWQQFHRDISQDALYSEDAPYMDDLLRDLATVEIVNASQFRGGTQLKLDLRLADGNRVIAKPMRLSRDHVYKYTREEPFWLDPERHNAEIASFHLDRLLGFRRVPPCSGRRVNLKKEILGKSEDTNLLSTVFKSGANLCVIGNCKPWFCNQDHPSCTKGDLMEVAMCQFLPAYQGGIPVRDAAYPWSQGRKESKVWKGKNICLDILKDSIRLGGRVLLDLIEQGIFDFFLRNYDRHHYSQLRKYQRKVGCVLHLDNGKGFGNPLVDDDTFLAPVYQCCKLRRSTYFRLKELARPQSRLSNRLNASMSHDPIAPVITEVHLQAMDRRLETVLRTIDKCIRNHGESNVLVERLE
ncbi:glycosaminoglycan xylosylkinase-like [Patiria miniata]|uniref:FAM20 C-terminal domain-containing protein n=1 Tax=Patiria miniata TaxID=46514 RepID=A0A914B6A0_PATMI|nr:glycosaminoglycan xylosylkinase-like [Patiria miniata]